MKRPYVAVENADAVVDYFSEVNPSVPLMRVFHFLAGHIVRGTTAYEDGAQEAIGNWLTAGGQLLISHNHQDFMDPLELASLFEREKVFHPLRTRTVIPAKHKFFNGRYGGALSMAGAIPVFRKRDSLGDPKEGEAQRRKANDALINIFQARLNKGFHVVIYTEETRGLSDENAGSRDPRILKKTQIGIGRIACGAARPENIAIVCMGTIFGRDNKRRLHPSTYVMRPFPVAETPEEVLSSSTERLQQAVLNAADLAGFIG